MLKRSYVGKTFCCESIGVGWTEPAVRLKHARVHRQLLCDIDVTCFSQLLPISKMKLRKCRRWWALWMNGYEIVPLGSAVAIFEATVSKGGQLWEA